MTLGQYLIRYRTTHHLSQRQFAIKCNVSNGYIAMMEKGVNPKTGRPIIPTLPQLKKLAVGMNMTISELVDAVDDMPVDLSSSSEIGLVPSQVTDNSLSPAELDLLRKFRCLDERGKSAVLNTLDHEYAALQGEETDVIPRQA